MYWNYQVWSVKVRPQCPASPPWDCSPAPPSPPSPPSPPPPLSPSHWNSDQALDPPWKSGGRIWECSGGGERVASPPSPPSQRRTIWECWEEKGRTAAWALKRTTTHPRCSGEEKLNKYQMWKDWLKYLSGKNLTTGTVKSISDLRSSIQKFYKFHPFFKKAIDHEQKWSNFRKSHKSFILNLAFFYIFCLKRTQDWGIFDFEGEDGCCWLRDEVEPQLTWR